MLTTSRHRVQTENYSLQYGLAAESLSISGCQTCLVDLAFLSSQGSHPASRKLESCVPVEAFPSRGHVDVDGFHERQLFGVSRHVKPCDILIFDVVLVLPSMLRYCRLLQCPFLAGLLAQAFLTTQLESGSWRKRTTTWRLNSQPTP